MKLWRKVAVVVLSLAVCATIGCGRKPDKILRADSKDLKHTIITAHLEEKIVPGKNLIYCSTFQLAWNELRDNIIKEDIRLEGNPPLVEFLNKKLATKADIDEGSYVAMAGLARDDAVNRIRSAVKSRFGCEAPGIEGQFGPQDIIAYGFLSKELKFKTAFESLKKPLLFRGTQVRAFGIQDFKPEKERHTKLAHQLSIILHYQEPESIQVVKLLPTSANDEIVLCELQPRKTLLETIRQVEEAISEGEVIGLHTGLQIPKFDFDLKHRHGELLGKRFLNTGFAAYFLAEAAQSIRFQLNEQGATLRSWALLHSKSKEPPIFDSRFLLYLKEKQARFPYLAIWVDNPEILMKW